MGRAWMETPAPELCAWCEAQPAGYPVYHQFLEAVFCRSCWTFRGEELRPVLRSVMGAPDRQTMRDRIAHHRRAFGRDDQRTAMASLSPKQRQILQDWGKDMTASAIAE